MTLQIRATGPADAAVVHALTQDAFAEHAHLIPPSPVLSEQLADAAADLAADPGLLALDGDLPVGALRTRPDPAYPGSVRWVRRVAVGPAYRRRGIGSLLLRAAAAAATADGLHALRADVRSEIAGYRPLYGDLGWQVVAQRAAWVVFGLPLARRIVDAAAMRALGARLGARLSGGDLVLLRGPLGAGKTVLAQGIAAGLGVTERVTSPTFVLAREHTGGRLPFIHVDAYRLSSLAELDDLDLDTALPTAVTVVEWGAGLAEGLADSQLRVEVSRSDDPADEVRRVTLRAVGTAWAERQQWLDTAC